MGFDVERYGKQTVLPGVGPEGQEKISRARVLVVGCGGLAAPVCTYLLAAGVGELGIVDADRVELSNLHRQTLFGTEDLGEFKVEAAKRRLAGLGHPGGIETFREHFDAGNAREIAQKYDVLVDCTDNFAAKFLVNDVAVLLGLPFVFASVTGFDGQFGVFHGGSCYRCLFPAPPKSAVRNCAEAGVLGAAAGVIGTWQALECLKAILGLAETGRIRAVDLWGGSQESYHVPRNPACRCTRPESIVLESAPAPACAFPARTISLPEAQGMGFLDVREDDEVAAGMLPDAQHWPLSRMERGEYPPFLEERSSWVLYCALGRRSVRAIELAAPKFPRTAFFSLAGGIAARHGAN